MPADPKTLFPWNVFRRQTTDHVAEILDSLNIKVVKVPANLTHFFQLLDLTVRVSAKHFMRKMFATWYAAEIKKKMMQESQKKALMLILN